MPVLGPLVHLFNFVKLGPIVLNSYVTFFSTFRTLNRNARMGQQVHKI